MQSDWLYSRRLWLALDAWLVVLVTLLDLFLGIAMVTIPEGVAGLAGWPSTPPVFLLRRLGLFYVVVGVGYFAEYMRYRSMFLLVSSKLAGFLFLMITSASEQLPRVVSFAGMLDGLIVITAVLIHRTARGLAVTPSE